MTETQAVAAKPKTGTARIVWGAILLAFALFGLFRLPVVVMDGGSGLGAIVGILLFAGFGVLLFATGLSQRKHHLSANR